MVIPVGESLWRPDKLWDKIMEDWKGSLFQPEAAWPMYEMPTCKTWTPGLCQQEENAVLFWNSK